MRSALFLVLFLFAGCTPALRTRDSEGQALARVALDVLASAACPRLLVRTVSLDDPRQKGVSGKLWVRKCEARPAASRSLDVDVEIIGWQWAGEASWGFRVEEYVYFTALVRARLSAEVDATNGGAALRVWTVDAPDVTVREIGRVATKPLTPASALLGFVGSIAGEGPNELATSALRSRVKELVRDRARSGLAIALDGSTAVTPRGPDEGPVTQAPLLDETQLLHPGGALLSGAYDREQETELRYAVDGTTLVRPVCADEAATIVDATIAGAPRHAGEPTDVLTLRGSGTVRLPARGCTWLLVSGAATDTPVEAKLVLSTARPRRHHTAEHWVRPTLVGFTLDAAPKDPRLLGVAIGRKGALETLGRPMRASPAIWLTGRPVALGAGMAIDLRIASLKPRGVTWYSAEPRWDETELGVAHVFPTVESGHEEQDVAIDANGTTVGHARIAIDVIEALP